MASDSNTPSFPNDEIEILEDDLLDEADLDDDALAAGGFDEEATQVFDPEAHDDAPFEAESTQIYRPDEEGTLDADAGDGFVEEATQVWQSPEPTPAPAPRPESSSASPVVVAPAPQRPDDHESTVVTSTPLRPAVRQVVSAPVPAVAQRASVMPWVLVALALAFAAVAAFLLRSDRPAPVETATLALFSSPTNASVLLNGVPREQRTPLSIPDLEVGTAYRLELRVDGYEAVEQTVVIEQAGLLSREIELPPVLGTVVVRTFPEGAIVSLDGVERGPSPVTLDALDRSRSYTVAANAEGYVLGERAVSWEENTQTEQVVVLTLEPVVAELEADALEDDAEPAESEAPPAAREPARERTARATPPAPARSEQDARARHLPATTPSRLSAAPAAAPPVTRPSERPSARTSPPPTPAPPVPAPAPPAPPAMGQLSVQAVPYGQVYVNNRMVDSETPLIGYEIEAGVHAVKVFFVGPNTWSEEQSVRIEPGANRVVTFRAR